MLSTAPIDLLDGFRLTIASAAGAFISIYIDRVDEFWSYADSLQPLYVVSDITLPTIYESCAWYYHSIIRPPREYDIGRGSYLRVWGESDSDKCTYSKHPYKMKILVPGILLVLRGGCRRVVRFLVMKTSESPAFVFLWILQHCRKSPRYVMYDKACNLARYCYTRKPVFFCHTMFVVDRFYFKGHVHCSPVFDTD